MSLFGFFRRKKSANVAKERLRMVLSYERKDLPPNFTDKIQSDLIDLFQKYPQFNLADIEINVKEGNQRDELYISIPFVGRGHN
ncbi:MAG: cell division topological specificity factor MinE [Candidatus Dadabacteria bacterium RIFCSPHIGHO2_12_FULL_53_21]|nr:MAG: cell division topological specificity factor MinE [Candidatus Dadabacteria bacterium RIFCSPHIGHO2_12_FULL_53_21]